MEKRENQGEIKKNAEIIVQGIAIENKCEKWKVYFKLGILQKS